ncbi:Isoprenylcysteine carboxyl methyltransferase [Collimonas arenae]|uniref:Isoprenylcysteine carboxyl methyltransferase n=1 Tax=Collimonas arenae TaxID=279058 RepID=A0A0A1F6V8_9BURK|nr:isoprenylcysteine carboxylmethyltransferase family protein [Collimonas arenae]AIY39414.1 Isoprenylcysteine carboxyl methyltransferase [Collimonas arenae]
MTIDSRKITAFQMLWPLGFPFVFPASMLFIAGDWLWVQCWIWGAWFIAMCWSATLYLYIKDQDLLKERLQPMNNVRQKKDATYLVYLFGFLYVVWSIVMPLDARRYMWTTGFPYSLEVLGALLLLGAWFLIFRTFSDNTFASALVRVQSERKQKVISTGVYGFVRHPMYLGAILLFVGTPLLLGSFWGLVTSPVFIFLLAVRTLGEEKMLTDELDGYVEYKRKVRYRFVPFIW